LLLLLEGCERPGRGDAFIVNLLKQQSLPVLVALNKWDLVAADHQEQAAASYDELLAETHWPVHRCSAISGDGCRELSAVMAEQLPLGPQLYPPDMVTDQPERVLLGELIREQVLLHTREEVPHSVAVTIDRVEDIPPKGKNPGRTAVLATVLVERKSQKGILIGKGGAMLKTIGQGARLQMQTLIDGSVYLELFVKVVPDWRSKPHRLAELGYGGGDF
jgi:GTP-binding protein Era